MTTKLKRIICKDCGRKRVPYIGSKGRATKSCKECKGNVFWQSKFGEWFASATTRQSVDSMPLDNEDIILIHGLWKHRERASGWKEENGSYVKKFNYHICHRDPVKGEGYQGRFTYGNLMICDSETNQSLKNKAVIDHGFRVYTNKSPFGSKENVRRWCTSKYNLLALIEVLGLKKKVISTSSPLESDDLGEYLPQGIPPTKLIESELKRFQVDKSPWLTASLTAKQKQEAVLFYGIGLNTNEPLSVDELEATERQEF